MNTPQQLKEEAREEFEKTWKETMQYSDDYGDRNEKGNAAKTIFDFIDSLITKAYEVGRLDAMQEMEAMEKWIEGGDMNCLGSDTSDFDLGTQFCLQKLVDKLTELKSILEEKK